MKVSEYASDVNLSVAEILKKCHELAINVNNKDDYLTDDDIKQLLGYADCLIERQRIRKKIV